MRNKSALFLLLTLEENVQTLSSPQRQFVAPFAENARQATSAKGQVGPVDEGEALVRPGLGPDFWRGGSAKPPARQLCDLFASWAQCEGRLFFPEISRLKWKLGGGPGSERGAEEP